MTAKRNQPKYLILGELLRPHGVKGELRMRIITDYPERLLSDLKQVFIGSDPDQAARPHFVKAARFHQNYLLLELNDITDRDAADLLRGQYVMVDIEHAVPLQQDEFYLYELIGVRVRTSQGEEIGTINDVLETGANDVYVIESSKYGQLLIPAHDETIIEIDLENQWITMDIPDGILPA